MAFKDYMKNRARLFEESQKQADEAKKGAFEKDPLEWYPTTNKDGNGVAIIRFLPGRESEVSEQGVPLDIVRYYTHTFKHEPTGKWYIENCLSTLNPKFLEEGENHPHAGLFDPVMDYNTMLYNSAPRDPENPKKADPMHPNTKQASNQKRSVNYRCNVYVVTDSNVKDNNGKPKKWRFGQTVFNEICEAIRPKEIPGITPPDAIPVFDLVTGACLQITISNDPTKKINGKPAKKYKYSWVNKGPLFNDEEKMGEVYDEINNNDKWSLSAYIAPDKFKARDVLLKRLVLTLGFEPFAEKTSTPKPVRNILDNVEPAVSAPSVFEEVEKIVNEPLAPKAVAPQMKGDADFFATLVSEEAEDDAPWNTTS